MQEVYLLLNSWYFESMLSFLNKANDKDNDLGLNRLQFRTPRMRTHEQVENGQGKKKRENTHTHMDVMTQRVVPIFSDYLSLATVALNNRVGYTLLNGYVS